MSWKQVKNRKEGCEFMWHKFLGETLNFIEILRISKILMKYFKILEDLGLIGVGTQYLMKWLPGKSSESREPHK